MYVASNEHPSSLPVYRFRYCTLLLFSRSRHPGRREAMYGEVREEGTWSLVSPSKKADFFFGWMDFYIRLDIRRQTYSERCIVFLV